MVTAAVFVAYKALKLVEPAGQNFAPGATMITAAALLLWLHRRDLGRYGVVSFQGLQLGALLVTAVLPPWLYVMWAQPQGSWRVLPGLIGLLAVLVAVVLRVPASRARSDAPLLLVVLVLAIAVGVTLRAGVAVEAIASAVTWRLLFTGPGEELFFRGYAQSRLDIAWGRPFRLLGIECGPGLLVAALLFGCVHLLNPARIFHGDWDLAWPWGAAALVSGLLYGLLREMTGTLWAGTVVHGVTGALQELAKLAS